MPDHSEILRSIQSYDCVSSVTRTTTANIKIHNLFVFGKIDSIIVSDTVVLNRRGRDINGIYFSDGALVGDQNSIGGYAPQEFQACVKVLDEAAEAAHSKPECLP